MKILVCGSGQIGRSIAQLLWLDGNVTIADSNQTNLDICCSILQNNVYYKVVDFQHDDLVLLVKDFDIVINALPHHLNKKLIHATVENNKNYFDLTEDVDSRYYLLNELIKHKTNTGLFGMHCGLAPGLVSIIAGNMIRNFNEVIDVRMRVGALPVSSLNYFSYNVNWSIDGLINECNKPCEAISHGKRYKTIKPLEGKEDVFIDGIHFEAFNTSGGLGTLLDSYPNVHNMDYKTLRYPAHLEKFKYYMDKNYIGELKTLLTKNSPPNKDDVVYYIVSVIGKDHDGNLREDLFTKKVESTSIFSAIQETTAKSCAAVVQMFINGKFHGVKGLLKQEDIDFHEFKNTHIIKNSNIV